MSAPPFRLNASGLATLQAATSAGALGFDLELCCDSSGHTLTEHTPQTRTKLHQLDPHLHCSVIGTCLHPNDLRKLMLRHGATEQMSDLDVHHLAVHMAMERGDASKAIQKALDQKHAGALKQFSGAKDERALETAWRAAWSHGDIAGGYWALLTHKAVTSTLLQLAYGEVHMLSHLMASANRDDLKRFVALEKENSSLRERLERRQARHGEVLRERDQVLTQEQARILHLEARVSQMQETTASRGSEASASELVALHTTRREKAERSAEKAWQEVQRLQEHAAKVELHMNDLAEELHAAEHELQRLSANAAQDGALRSQQKTLQDRTILYVGGRPSSTPSIRDFVQQRGGEFLHHDGGLETRKALLTALLPRAHLVVFPVDCVDHDSVTNLKRLCERHMVPFMPLRTASLASFARSLQREADTRVVPRPSHFCLRHG